jgi:hypothetical protein
MKTLPLAHVKMNLSRLGDQVVETDEEIVAEIRRGRQMLERGGKIYTLEELLPQD